MFLVNSRYRRFSASSFDSGSKSLHLMEAHLLPKLRSQLAEFLNEGYLKRLGMLSLPTCVGSRYDRQINSLEAFLGSMGSTSLCPNGLLIASRSCDIPDLPGISSYELEPTIPAVGWPTLLRPPITQTLIWRYRNINLFSIAYAFRPRLRISTNPEKISFTQETLDFRRYCFSQYLSLLMSA